MTGAALLWFKLSGSFFPPASALAALYLDSAAMSALGWTYVFFPCLTGNLAIWAAAAAGVRPRRALRELLVRRLWVHQSLSSEAVRLLADVYGDKSLGHAELCLVLGETRAQPEPDECAISPGGQGAASLREFNAIVSAANERASAFEAASDPCRGSEECSL